MWGEGWEAQGCPAQVYRGRGRVWGPHKVGGTKAEEQRQKGVLSGEDSHGCVPSVRSPRLNLTLKSCPDTIHQVTQKAGTRGATIPKISTQMSKAGPERGREWPRVINSGCEGTRMCPITQSSLKTSLVFHPLPQGGTRTGGHGRSGEWGAGTPSVSWHSSGSGG